MASDSELCDAVVKSIAPDLPLRTWLESKADLNLVSMSKILRLHFGKPYTTTLFKKLGNAKQMPTETTYEFLIRMMSFRQKILFMSNEDECCYSISLIQDIFIYGILEGLHNDNIRHEFWLLLKTTIVSDEDILDSLDFATTDELEQISKFRNKQINISTTETSEDISKPHKDKKQN